MKINKIVIFAGIFLCAAARADTPDFMDAQIAELTARRDALRAEIAECEDNTHKYKFAGISTLAATGVGVVGNIALHNKIQAAQKGGTRSGSGGGVGGAATDTATKQEKLDSDCKQYCEDSDLREIAIEEGCSC